MMNLWNARDYYQIREDLNVKQTNYRTVYHVCWLLELVCEIVTGTYVDVVSDCDIVNVMISISPFLARNNVTVTNTHVD